MAGEIRINAFDMNCVGHIQQGLWTHPRDQSSRYQDLHYWRKPLEEMVLGSQQPPWVGSADAIAQKLVDWSEQAGVDGFNLARTVVPECFDDFIALVVPRLQERGAFKTAYAQGTLRGKLSRRDRLPESHPAKRSSQA